jgi:hypothetical protein
MVTLDFQFWGLFRLQLLSLRSFVIERLGWSFISILPWLDHDELLESDGKMNLSRAGSQHVPVLVFIAMAAYSTIDYK